MPASHIITSTSWCGLISLSLGVANPAAGQVDQQRAEAYFKEAAAICERDGGRLWGVSLCGPNSRPNVQPSDIQHANTKAIHGDRATRTPGCGSGMQRRIAIDVGRSD